MTTPIEETWQRLSAGGTFPVQTRVSADHPLDLFAQIDSEQRPGLLAISDREPDKAPTYLAVEISFGKRGDGRWAMSLSLSQPSLLPIFATMCNQIVQQGSAVGVGTNAIQFVLAQVARWHRLLALGSDGLLAAEEQQGLFGEIEILRIAIARYGPDAASGGWIGPDDASQDFDLPDGLVEAKTIGAGQPLIWISSLDQLDVDCGRLCVVVVELVQVASGTGGISLAGAIASVRDQLTSNPLALQRFEEQLQKAGYVDREEYGLSEYRVARIRWFAVREDFPRLARTKLPAALAGARYQLVLTALGLFETNPFGDHGKS